MIRYGSVCSGIEAATLAWEPMGWQAAWFAEIEKFPSAVLKYHWPDVPNLGDMCQLPDMIRGGLTEAPDVLVGGTPCQAFSVAGARRGMIDPRGMLTMKYVEVADAIDEQRPHNECIIVWENVPGVLSDRENAFGCFLGSLVGEEVELQPPRGRWANAGMVYGPKRTAGWRVIDAQFFGVAQRRRRVFVVASARDGFDPYKVLFVEQGVRRNTPPSREKGESVAGYAADCFGIDGEQNASHESIGTLRSHQSGGYEGARVASCYANAGYFGTMQSADVSDPLRAKGGDTGNGGETVVCVSTGQSSAEIGIGIGTTLNCNHEAPIVVHGTQDPCISDIAFAQGRNNGGENVICQYGPVAGSQTARHDSSSCADRGMNVIAFKPGQSADSRSIGAQEEVACTLESAGGGNNKQAVAFQEPVLAYGVRTAQTSSNGWGVQEEVTHTLDRAQGLAVAVNWSVRRLTPLETERLQGMPDGHTAIPGTADGPRYKSIGNSKAVPCIAWIGRQIERHL